MKKRPELVSELRTTIGHQVKKIRGEGNIPATVYGHNYKSQSLSINTDAFLAVYKEVGETGLVDLTIKGSSVPVLIHTIQKHPVNQTVLHVEFFKVNLSEKIKAHIPVVITGTSPAVEQHLGNLLTVIQEIEVEALPDELPESITIDVSSLREVNDEIKVEEISVPKGVSLLTEKGAVVVKIGALVVEKEPEPTLPTENEETPQEAKEESIEEKQESPSQE
jgi:large subunit ribosomal protein L25